MTERQARTSDGEITFSRAKTIAFSLTAVLLVWAALEVVCAAVWSTVVADREDQHQNIANHLDMVNLPLATEPDEELFWQPRANCAVPHRGKARLVGFIANSDRMRNEEVCVERGPDDFRVLCLGDSITFGWGVEYEEAYPTVLKGLLREALPGKRPYVLNAGCTGYTAHQGAVLLRRRGLKYQPDVVTIWFMWNDGAAWGRRTDEETARLFQFQGVLRHSAAFKLLSHLVRRKASKYDAETGEKRDRRARMPLPDYEKRLREMVDLARNGRPNGASHRRAGVVFICGCFAEQLDDAIKNNGRYTMDDRQKRMLAVAADVRAPVVMLIDELRRAGLGRDVFMDAGHIDARGMRVVAAALARTMAENGMLPVAAAQSAPGAAPGTGR